MTIGKCKECKKDVSDEASSCPHCGVKNPVKKTSKGTWIILGLIIFGVLGVIATPKDPNYQASPAVAEKPKDIPIPVKKLTQDEELQQLAKACVAAMRSQLQDPDSAKLPDAYADFPAEFATKVKDNVFMVQFDFHAKNGFNALRSYKGDCKWKKQKNGDFDPISLKNWPN